jgi:hypothetical protein
MSQELTSEERIAAAQKRREAVKAAHERAFSAQLADDLEAIADLEEDPDHGWTGITVIDIPDCWKPGRGAATRLAFKLPERGTMLYRQFLDFLNRDKSKPGEKTKVGDQLGMDCLVYPEPKSEMARATLELAAGVLQTAAIEIGKAVSGRRAEEGK